MERRILVVDDSPTQAERVRLLIEGEGYRVEVAANGCEGLRRVQLAPPDLIISDVVMPEMDGFAFCRAVKSAEATRRIPFVLLTQWSALADIIQGFEAGADNIISKPFADATLLERVRQIFEQLDRQTCEGPEQETTLHIGDHRFVVSAGKAQILELLLFTLEEKLRESEERFRSVAQSAPDAIIIANESGQIISWNKGAQGIFGYALEEVVGKPITILMPERYRDAHEAGLERFKSTGEAHLIGRLVEVEGLRKNGSDFPLEFSLASWQTGEERFFSAILRDITERKQLQMQLEAMVEERTRELQDTNRHLEVALRHRSQFLANVSHELRTPLSAILGFSEFLQDPAFGPFTEKQGRYVGHIHNSGTHLLALINDLLDLSKVEAGRLDLRPEAFPLADALTAALEQFRAQVDAKGMALALRLEQAPDSLVADPLRFKQILHNLLGNAVKFTPAGGSITVTAKIVSRSESGVSSSQPETASASEFVEIAVSDTGIGINAEDLGRLFQEFTRLDSSFAKPQQGTGLGLAMAKRLVDLHGGSVTATSPGEGQGSTFTVTLPLRPS